MSSRSCGVMKPSCYHWSGIVERCRVDSKFKFGETTAKVKPPTAVRKSSTPDPVTAEARKALALDPNFAWAHSLLGQALFYTGHSEESIAPPRAAIRLDPNFDSHLHYLAQAYFGL